MEGRVELHSNNEVEGKCGEESIPTSKASKVDVMAIEALTNNNYIMSSTTSGAINGSSTSSQQNYNIHDNSLGYSCPFRWFRACFGCVERKHDYETADDKDLLCNALSKAFSWDEFDVFFFSASTKGRPLEVLFMHLLEVFDLFDKLKLEQSKCRGYACEIEARYTKENCYHNNIHAADVLQSVGVILMKDCLYKAFSSLEILSMLVSATIHDVEHPGVTNAFHIKTRSDLAIRYNDISVNEQMHVSRAYEILLQGEHNMLEDLSEEDYSKLRKLIIDTVLATDMAGHNALVAQFSEEFPVENGFRLTSSGDPRKNLLIRMIVHCADISNPARPWVLCRQWSHRITEEMLCQGDKEKKLGRDPDSLHDRNKNSISRDQMFFLENMVIPCFKSFGNVARCFVKEALKFAFQNKQHWTTYGQEDDPQNNQLGVLTTTN